MKIAVDTNIVIRLIVLDDKAKVKMIEELIETYERKDIFVCSLVVMEAYHALTKFYHFFQEAVMDSFEKILKIEQLAFEHEASLRQAIIKARKGYPFKDALIGEIGATRNLKTLTFDKGLKANPSFQVL